MELDIFSVTGQFLAECQKLEQHRAGSSMNIALSVALPSRYEREGPPKVELTASFFDGSNHQTVRAASLGALMDEVHRRAGFEDKQAVALDAVKSRLTALPSPSRG